MERVASSGLPLHDTTNKVQRNHRSILIVRDSRSLSATTKVVVRFKDDTATIILTIDCDCLSFVRQPNLACLLVEERFAQVAGIDENILSICEESGWSVLRVIVDLCGLCNGWGNRWISSSESRSQSYSSRME